MTQKTRSYSSWRTEKLSDPARAARYLDVAFNESREAFFHALQNVIQAHQVSTIAKKAGVTRESLYRSFSATGNPKLDTIESVLDALDVKFSGIEPRVARTAAPPSGTSKPTSVTGIRKRRGRKRRTSNSPYQQLSLQFSYVVPIPSVGGRVPTIEQRSYAGPRTRDDDVLAEMNLLPGFIQQQQQSGATAYSFLP